MEGSKWVATVASIWIQCSCGASYTFGIYSPILKSSQGYDQSTLDTISVFKDIGANVGVFAGLFYSAVVSRRGSTPSFWRQPWVVHAVGALLCFVGYFYLWLAVTGAIPRPPVALTCFFIFVAAQALTFFNTSNIVTSVQNFPNYGGTIVGIMKGFLGLSAAILIQVYQTLFGGNASAFLLMLAVVSPLFSICLMFFVRIHDTPSKGDEDQRHLNAFSLIAIIVAAYIMLLIIADNVLDLPQSVHALAFAVLIVLLSSPLSVAIRAYTDRKASSPLPSLEAPLIKDENKLDDDDKIDNETSIVDLDAAEDLNVVQAMRTLNFWLLFIAMFCAMGSGLATINNITQMGESLGYTPRERNTLVSLWSIWNFLGRFVAGYVSDVFLHKKGLARTFFMPVTLATMTIGHLIISSGVSGNLYIGSVLVGICFGSQWSLMPTITSEIFGVTHMGTIFNTIAVASPLGSYILSVRVIGYLYDKEASGGGMGDSCIGIHCFRTSFFILASVSVIGFMVSLVFLARTRGIYARIVRRRMWA